MDEPYRSYVIRIHRLRGGGPSVRVDIEDLQGGGRVAMRGVVAGRVARILARVVGRPEDPARA